jgi:hypothetical protein
MFRISSDSVCFILAPSANVSLNNRFCVSIHPTQQFSIVMDVNRRPPWSFINASHTQTTTTRSVFPFLILFLLSIIKNRAIVFRTTQARNYIFWQQHHAAALWLNYFVQQMDLLVLLPAFHCLRIPFPVLRLPFTGSLQRLSL